MINTYKVYKLSTCINGQNGKIHARIYKSLSTFSCCLHNLLQCEGLGQVALDRELPRHEGRGGLEFSVEHLEKVVSVHHHDHVRFGVFRQGTLGHTSLIVLQVNNKFTFVVELELEQSLHFPHNICVSYRFNSVKYLKLGDL